MDKIKILLVDDQKLILDGLTVLIESEDLFEVIGTADTGELALESVNRLLPDVVLMDIRMPGMGGVEATRRIKELHPNIYILILTTFDDDSYIIDALNYGASGYLLKDIGKEKLNDAIKEVLAGNLLITGRVAYKLAQSIKRTSSLQSENYADEIDFTDREKEIIRLMLQGLSNKEICERLQLTLGTVKNYMSVIYSKLGVNERTKAILLLQGHF